MVNISCNASVMLCDYQLGTEHPNGYTFTVYLYCANETRINYNAIIFWFFWINLTECLSLCVINEHMWIKCTYWWSDRRRHTNGLTFTTDFPIIGTPVKRGPWTGLLITAASPDQRDSTLEQLIAMVLFTLSYLDCLTGVK